VNAGSRNEVSYPSGISHCLERLAFAGSSSYQTRDAVMQAVEKLGGICDCQTSRYISINRHCSLILNSRLFQTKILQLCHFLKPENTSNRYWRNGLSTFLKYRWLQIWNIDEWINWASRCIKLLCVRCTFFYKNTRLIFAQNLRTIPASAEEQSLKFSAKIVNKTAARVAQLTKRILLRAYTRTTAVPGCASTNKNFI